MAYQPIDLGSAPNDGTGDKPRPAGTKINANFVELYAAVDALESGKEDSLGFTPVNKAGDTMSGNLAMGANKITGLAAASAAGEALRYEQGPNGFPAVDTSGTAISFAVPQIYGTEGAPETGNITIVTTGLVKGMTQLLIHNNGSEPTYGSEIKIISGAYATGVINYIMLMAVSSSRVLVTISQEV